MDLQAQRRVGAAMAIVAGLAMVIAFLVQPVAEWGAWGFIIAAIDMIFLFAGLLAVVSKNPTMLTGRLGSNGSPRWTMIAIVLIAIALVFMVISGFIGGWTAAEVLQLGIFAALGCLLVGTLLAARAR